MFKAYGVKKIIFTCPHDYNVVKKEYKEFAKVGVGSDGNPLSYDFEVFHHVDKILVSRRRGLSVIRQRVEYAFLEIAHLAFARG